MKYTFKRLPLAALSMAALLFSFNCYALTLPEQSTTAQLRCNVDGQTPLSGPFNYSYGPILNGVDIGGSFGTWQGSERPSLICGLVVKDMCSWIKQNYPEGSYLGGDFVSYPFKINVTSTVFGEESATKFLCE